MHTHGVEKMEETFVERGNLFKDIYPLFWKYSEKLLLEGETNVFGSLHHGDGMSGKWGQG